VISFTSRLLYPWEKSLRYSLNGTLKRNHILTQRFENEKYLFLLLGKRIDIFLFSGQLPGEGKNMREEY